MEFFSQFQTAVGGTPTNLANSEAEMPLLSLVCLIRSEITSGLDGNVLALIAMSIPFYFLKGY